MRIKMTVRCQIDNAAFWKATLARGYTAERTGLSG
jgi:hypothetical protein